jgi:uncharacterized cupin superfamily protein
MPKINPATASRGSGSRYPPPYDGPCQGRSWLRLGDAAGLTQFGVNLVRLPPGAWSSQRHSHSHEDEFAWVLEGELVMITDAGEQVMRPGDCAGFKAGGGEAHQFINRGDKDALVLVAGSRNDEDRAEYPDIDLLRPGRSAGARDYCHKDGTPY